MERKAILRPWAGMPGADETFLFPAEIGKLPELALSRIAANQNSGNWGGSLDKLGPIARMLFQTGFRLKILVQNQSQKTLKTCPKIAKK